jgi:hypothetical protein
LKHLSKRWKRKRKFIPSVTASEDGTERSELLQKCS